MFDDRRWIHAKERMPNRAIWEMLTIFGNGIGIILCFTIIGIPLGLPLILFGLFAAYPLFATLLSK